MTDAVVFLSCRRTPIGAFQGALASLTAPQLGSVAMRAAISSAGVAAADLDEVVMGCVLPAGLGQAPARQAALGADVPTGVPATTVNKMCGSAMKAIMLGADQLAAGRAALVLAGGLESMSNAPYLLPKARTGYRMGHGEILDHMFYDGLQSPWDGKLMGCFADATAQKYAFSREQQDAFAAESVRRAMRALEAGDFDAEVAPVEIKGRKGVTTVARDETPLKCDLAKIATLKPAFGANGTVTAASSSSISDGAAAAVLARESVALQRNLQPVARLVAWASSALSPEWFTVAPVAAINKVLQAAAWKASDVDLYEINEAFAVVAMAAIRELGLDHGRVNVRGGACALGHPIGATGARIITTLIHALRQRGGRRGVAALCIGGGEATAVAIELV
ncbi:MAG: acetyl-CoA C-acyltransferase [Proteobacteria bacterium]|nr:acetyl-CoA C-acyltransferase [Pseudomonadota bacterium]